MKELVEVHKFTCDACGAIQYVGDGEEILGLQGDVMEVAAYGGMGGEWFACSRKCVAKAITNVLDRRD